MGVKVLLMILIILFAIVAVSYAYIGEEAKPSKSAIYTMGEDQNQMKTFVAGESQNKIVSVNKNSNTNLELNARRFNMEQQELNKELEMKSKLRRVARSADGKTIIGYSKELDNPGFEKVNS